MGIRHLTQLELRRLTGQSDIDAQIQSLDDQKLPYTLRRGVGRMVLGINCYTSEIRPLLSVAEWDVIRDESIGTGMALLARSKPRCKHCRKAL